MSRTTLDKIPAGLRVKVLDLHVEQDLKSRLISMGVYRGAVLTVINCTQNHVIISLDSGFGRRIVLSCDIARKVIVEYLH